MDLLLITKNQHLEKLAETDSLTGTLNRRAVFQRAEIEIERAFRHQRNLTALLFDIDSFKQINDHLGHQAGDDLLIGVTKKIGPALRKIDLFGRYGGDEFLIVLPDTTLDYAELIAKRICTLAEKTEIQIDGSTIPFTISIGISELSEGDTLKTMVSRADKALLRAKRTDRNQVCIEKNH